MIKVGIISDTHGELPRAAMHALKGCDQIIHAGDIGSLAVLLALQQIAPTTAVLGNCDMWSSADFGGMVNDVAEPKIGGVRFHVVHRPADIRDLPDDVRVVVFGHTHKAQIKIDDGILYINPGSASRPEYGDDASVATLDIDMGEVKNPQIIEL